MGKFFNKLRQVFNIFLIFLLIGLAAAVCIYFLTTPEQRGTTFWISAGFLVFALIFETFIFSGIAMRSNKGKEIPVSFTKVIWAGLYFIFVIGVSIWNARAGFTVIKYTLIHIVGLVVFLVPMVMMNMLTLKMSGSDRKEREEGRLNLYSLANKVAYVVQDLISAGVPQGELARLNNLAEQLRYSDPAPASKQLERDLENAVKNLEAVAVNKNAEEISRACTLAERALRERNDFVINSK